MKWESQLNEWGNKTPQLHSRKTNTESSEDVMSGEQAKNSNMINRHSLKTLRSLLLQTFSFLEISPEAALTGSPCTERLCNHDNFQFYLINIILNKIHWNQSHLQKERQREKRTVSCKLLGSNLSTTRTIYLMLSLNWNAFLGITYLYSCKSCFLWISHEEKIPILGDVLCF